MGRTSNMGGSINQPPKGPIRGTIITFSAAAQGPHQTAYSQKHKLIPSETGCKHTYVEELDTEF